MPDEARLKEQARQVVQNGKLPARTADRTWGGTGVGASCVVCGLSVTTDEMELEIEFAHDGDDPAVDRFHLHVRCFAAWDRERTKIAASAASGLSDDS